VYLVKQWVKNRKIHEPYKGYLSSYSYTLMVMHYLQVAPHTYHICVCVSVIHIIYVYVCLSPGSTYDIYVCVSVSR
jgi:DNA polymerase sigma